MFTGVQIEFDCYKIGSYFINYIEYIIKNNVFETLSGFNIAVLCCIWNKYFYLY